ncbi:MAG: YjjG family noncanonical pyrimidine nucleotidase [Bacteroidales bacterium]
MLDFLKRRHSYRHLFFDLDRTLWDFEQNKVDALRDIYFDYQLDIAFPNILTFIDTFTRHNDYLWDKYIKGELSKDVLRFKRFEITLNDYGIDNQRLAKTIGDEYLKIMPLKTALVPGTRDLLEYLGKKYKLHIISNGFNEVQLPKLQRCHIDHYFEWVVTSEIAGYHKPDPRVFGYSLSKANAKKEESLMIGDDLNVDIVGAKKFGIDQIYFNPGNVPHKLKITYEVNSLSEIMKIL